MIRVLLYGVDYLLLDLDLYPEFSHQTADAIIQADIGFIKPEGTEDDLLGLRNRMIQPIGAVVPSNHLDLFELPDRSGNSHIFLLRFHPDHLLLQQVINPVAHDQSDKLNKDLGRHAL